MNYENEITVKVNTTYDKLHNILLNNNYFVKKAVLVLNDTVRSNK